MRIPRRKGIWLVGLVLGGCAGSGWPDEPGVPVVVGQAQNARAASAFVESLTSRRRGEVIPEPIVTSRLQGRLRTIADQLQDGRLSADETRRVSEAWGRKAYRRDVDVWVLDCSAGRDMWLPPALIHRPTAVMSFAAAYFRPRSASSDQCAIVVVSANGADSLTMRALDQP